MERDSQSAPTLFTTDKFTGERGARERARLYIPCVCVCVCTESCEFSERIGNNGAEERGRKRRKEKDERERASER